MLSKIKVSCFTCAIAPSLPSPPLLSQHPSLIRILPLSFLRAPSLHLWEWTDEEHGERRRRAVAEGKEEKWARNGEKKDEKGVTRCEWRSVVECSVWGEDEGACHISLHKCVYTHTHTQAYTHVTWLWCSRDTQSRWAELWKEESAKGIKKKKEQQARRSHRVGCFILTHICPDA